MNRVIRKIENLLRTDDGQRFLQYAYSFGAAIVIFGALIKVLHIWGIWGNIIFGTGMAIECVVFILFGLDRPAKGYNWEQNFPVFETDNPEDGTGFSHGTNQPVILGNSVRRASSTSISSPIPEIDTPQNLSLHADEYGKQMENLNRNLSGLNTIYEIQLKSISGQIDTIAQINNGLNRLKTMYSDTIPDGTVIREETDKMADQLRELNEIYARMINAMNPQPPKGN